MYHTNKINNMKATIYNGITNSRLEVELIQETEMFSNREFTFCHYELNDERLYRIETKATLIKYSVSLISEK